MNAFARALVDRAGLTRADVHAAIDHAQTEDLTLLDAVLATELLPEIQCYRVFADAAGLELVDLDARDPSPLALRVVPARAARRHRAVPVTLDNREIVYAIDRAFDADADRDIAFAAGRQGRPVLACRSQIAAALDRFYPPGAGLEDPVPQPDVHGEPLDMQATDPTRRWRTLDELGYDPAAVSRIRDVLDQPGGLILVSGPAGAGKTTAVYGALDHLRTTGLNIVTVEDAAEGNVPSVSAVLDSALRQDPDVLMVGDIRDADVASVVGQAAHGGRRVLTTLQANDAASAITRLLTLGLEPSRVATCLTAVVAQRLVRQLCPSCAAAGTPGGTLDQQASQAGTGCRRCQGTGYIERVPVVEILVPDSHLRHAIARGASAVEMRRAMTAAGCPSMRDYGIELVRRGVTSLDELNRVVADDRLPALRAAARRRVLVVDDDPMQRRLVRALLEREGLDVIEGEHGAHALELSRRERPDLLLCDLLMPEVDGFDAIAGIRREPSLMGLPIIVLTTEDGADVERRVLALGADDYLRKPIEGKLLLSRVRAVFHRAVRAAA